MRVIVTRGVDAIRPETAEGDAYFGLAPGTNGTGPEAHRLLAELSRGAVGYRWYTHSGSQPLGLLVAGRGHDDNWRSPWGVRVSPVRFDSPERRCHSRERAVAFALRMQR